MANNEIVDCGMHLEATAIPRAVVARRACLLAGRKCEAASAHDLDNPPQANGGGGYRNSNPAL